jgi:acyl carrier protein
MDVYERLVSLLSIQTGLESNEITPDKNLKDDLNIDSLDIVEFIMDLEEEFDIKIESEDTEHLRTVGDFVALIENKNLYY